MDSTEQQKIANRIKLLLNLTLANGCMPGEVEVAAYKIGSLVQKYGLRVSFPYALEEESSTQQERPYRPEHRRTPPRRQAAFAHIEVLIIGETEKALFCRSQEDEGEFWIPRSQCREGCEQWGRGDSGTLYVSYWWAEKEGWT